MQCHWLSRLEVAGDCWILFDVTGVLHILRGQQQNGCHSSMMRDVNKITSLKSNDWNGWNPRMKVWKIMFIFKLATFKFHVIFEGVIESVAQTRGNMFMSLYPVFIDRSYSSWSPTVETNRNRERVHAASRWWWTFALMQLRNRFNALQGKEIVPILYKHWFYQQKRQQQLI